MDVWEEYSPLYILKCSIDFTLLDNISNVGKVTFWTSSSVSSLLLSSLLLSPNISFALSAPNLSFTKKVNLQEKLIENLQWKSEKTKTTRKIKSCGRKW